jgi:hypothetical protein
LERGCQNQSKLWKKTAPNLWNPGEIKVKIDTPAQPNRL